MAFIRRLEKSTKVSFLINPDVSRFVLVYYVLPKSIKRRKKKFDENKRGFDYETNTKKLLLTYD